MFLDSKTMQIKTRKEITNMKKLICFTTAVLLAALMVGCQPKESESFETGSTEAQTTQAQATQETEQTTEGSTTAEETTAATTDGNAGGSNDWTGIY